MLNFNGCTCQSFGPVQGGEMYPYIKPESFESYIFSQWRGGLQKQTQKNFQLPIKEEDKEIHWVPVGENPLVKAGDCRRVLIAQFGDPQVKILTLSGAELVVPQSSQ